MASVNKWIGLGNCCADPEMRAMPNGGYVTNITVACNDKYKNKQTGELVEKTEFVRIVFFNRLAEIAGDYLKKGSQVYIEGKLQTRKWQDQSGQDRYTTEIVASEMQMLGGKQTDDGGGDIKIPLNHSGRESGLAPQNINRSQAAPPPSQGMDDIDDDDIPF